MCEKILSVPLKTSSRFIMWTILCILLFTFTNALAQCPSPNGRFPVTGQCDVYTECRDGVATTQECPDGLLFKDDYRSGYPCGYPQEVDCSGRETTRPPTPTNECPRLFGFFRYGGPTECATFTNCANGRAYQQSCNEGLAFNEQSLDCDWPDLVPSCNAEEYLGFRCPDASPLSLYAAGTCDKFFACVNGRPRLMGCEKGKAFNAVTNSCDDAANVPGC